MENIVIFVALVLAQVAALAALQFAVTKGKDPTDPNSTMGFLYAIRRYVQGGILLSLTYTFLSTSFFYVGDNETGHIVKRFGGATLKQGKIIATEGENGPQADIYGPGLHIVPLITLYADVEMLPVVDIPKGYYGIVTALDGRKLPEDAVMASPLPGTSIAPSASTGNDAQVGQLFDAKYFLSEGRGYQGVQTTVLKPGLHRLNLYAFTVEIAGADGMGVRYDREGASNFTANRPTTLTQIPTGYVGVIKSNLQEDWRTTEECRRGQQEASLGEIQSVLVPDGCKGVWKTTFEPGAIFLNTDVYDITMIETRAIRWAYKGGYERCLIDLTVSADGQFTQTRECNPVEYNPNVHADKAITVKSEGWDIPVELRVLMQVRPEDAPSVVAAVGSVENIEDRIVTPTIRSVVRNIGGGSYLAPLLNEANEVITDENGDPKIGRRAARALDFQDHRAYLETAFEKAIMAEAKKAGITILEVKIGEPAIPPELLVARRRQQLSDQLIVSFKREQEAQEERIEAENAKARADQQPQLVEAEIDLLASDKRKQARQNDGEGEKNYLTQVAEGQKAQALVLGEDRVMALQMAERILKALSDNPELTNIVPDPQVLVIGGGNAENASAIGAGLLADKLGGFIPGAAK